MIRAILMLSRISFFFSQNFTKLGKIMIEDCFPIFSVLWINWDTYLCERGNLSMDKCMKFQVDNLKNGWALPSQMSKRPLFTLFNGISAFYFLFIRFELFENCLKIIFRRFYENLKTFRYHITQTQQLHFGLLWLHDLWWPWLNKRSPKA